MTATGTERNAFRNVQHHLVQLHWRRFVSELLCNGHSYRLSTGLMDQQLNQVCQISASGNSVSHGNILYFWPMFVLLHKHNYTILDVSSFSALLLLDIWGCL